MHVTHDLHTHNLFSSCSYDPQATTRNCVRKAMELGHRVFGISNHLWDESVPGASQWYRHRVRSGAEGKYSGGYRMHEGVVRY